VEIYADKIHQVIINVIDNAIFALSSVDQETKVLSISTDRKGDKAILRIYNNGGNIHGNILRKIFDPFFTTKAPEKGAGLGLSICYSLIQEHNGNIFAENEADGVKFTIEIPLQSSDKAVPED